tara:strand:+ start:1619 stop:2641 length:1023 start_codon:yes stop_codon:yes gene_type:complete
MKIKIQFCEGSLNHRQSTAPIGRQTVDVEDDEDREKLVFEEKAEYSIQKWVHEDAQKYALELIEKYGEPDVVTDKMVLWEDGISKFDKTYVLDESIEHCCPKLHRDYVYSTMTIDVPQELMESISKASESIIVDQLKNKVTARCADITANAITLGFVQKLVKGDIDPKDSKEEYERHIIEGIIPEWFNEKDSINEGDDRCTRIAKRKYDVWPSAYASGAVVRCRKGKIWKGLKENEQQYIDGYIISINLQEKKKAGTESSKENSLRDWFGRRGGKGKSKGWVDCNTCRKDKMSGKKTCKSCGRQEGEKRKKYPACRPTPAACEEKGKGSSWGKKSTKEKK